VFTIKNSILILNQIRAANVRKRARRKRHSAKDWRSLDHRLQRKSLHKVPNAGDVHHDVDQKTSANESTMPCDLLVRSRSSVCVPCKGESLEEDDPDFAAMENRNSRKQIYETAFDSKISKSEDELDEVSKTPFYREKN
jgi:hypothetical protein